MRLTSRRSKSGLTWFGLFLCAISAASENLDEGYTDHAFFISEIFDKYGNKNFMTYEGFEHLLENLGLGKLKFEKKHDVSIHKINGTFLEFHDKLSLHKHNHSLPQDEAIRTGNWSRSKRNLKADERNLNLDLNKNLRRKCLTAQDILTTYGLKPYHEVVISPSKYLQMCPAIVYELDQKLCQAEEATEVLSKQEEYHLVWIYASISIFVMGASGMLCVLIVPIVQKNFYSCLLQFLVSLAVGTLCGDALIHLIPQVFSKNGDPEYHLTVISKGTIILLAIYFFFVVENVLKEIQNQRKTKKDEMVKESGKMLPDNYELGVHGHGHGHGHNHGIKSVAWMAIMGDILHNVTDGLSIGAAFSTSLSSGFASSIAIFCHELPHELGDYAILLASGMSIKKSLFFNFLSSVFSFFGMVAGILLGEIEDASSWINAFTAGSFLYIALSDLVPEMRAMESKSSSKNLITQSFGLISGGILMFLIALYEDHIESLLC